MKLNFANPATGAQKSIEIEEDRKLRIFYDRRMGQEVELDSLGDEWKGYIAKIGGGNDKQGFPMKQGVLLPSRVRLLLRENSSCYRQRRTGERKRKSVRGCIVAADISALHLIVVKQGEGDIPGLTDISHPKRLGPKRANHIRKFYNLTKDDDVRKFVIRRTIEPKKEGKKSYTKAPAIQRLVTPQRLQRKRRLRQVKIAKSTAASQAAADYHALLSKRLGERKQKQAAIKARRASSHH